MWPDFEEQFERPEDVGRRQVAPPFHTAVLAEHCQQDSDPNLELPNAWTAVSPANTPCTAVAWGRQGALAEVPPGVFLWPSSAKPGTCYNHASHTGN